jgi:hypothetical protein
MTDPKPIDREFLLRELRELLAAPVREETQLDGSIVMIGGDPGEVIVRVRSRQGVRCGFLRPLGGAAHPGSAPQPLCNLELATAPGCHTDDDTALSYQVCP